MATLPPGGAGRTASLGTGTSRSRAVVAGRSGRGKTIPTPVQEAIGASDGRATVEGVSDFDIVGAGLLQENSDSILQETGDFLLLEDAASTGVRADGLATVSGVMSALVDATGSSDGVASVSGVMEVPSAADNILLEDGDDLLQETGDFLLLETGVVAPPTAIQDVDSFEITDTDDEYILEA